ncbi:MAG: hypothetical protein HOE90_20000 [Bacteriovoracaceae bacterium]|jgi:hypothetical protein|nr:hypothetical protein [Bacteriovoracaceae bacterium]
MSKIFFQLLMVLIFSALAIQNTEGRGRKRYWKNQQNYKEKRKKVAKEKEVTMTPCEKMDHDMSRIRNKLEKNGVGSQEIDQYLMAADDSSRKEINTTACASAFSTNVGKEKKCRVYMKDLGSLKSDYSASCE